MKLFTFCNQDGCNRLKGMLVRLEINLFYPHKVFSYSIQEEMFNIEIIQ